jgi:hypothetical protein
VPGVSAHRYLALSYVWPESRADPESATPPPRTSLLDNASLEEFQRPGALSGSDAEGRLPSVIKHALAFTRALDERYLWIVRLCIVQDDAGETGTLSQVGKMDKIYNGAYLTIIAAASDETYDDALKCEWPMFETVNPRIRKGRWDEDNILSMYKPSRWRPAVLNEEEVVGIMSGRYNILSLSRWATRGWTYQEQMLCKRAIIFLDDGLF